MKKPLHLVIDCAKTTTPAQIHESVAHQLHFPKHYGANLDALVDSLSDTLIEHPITLKWSDTEVSKRDPAIREIHAILQRHAR